MAAAPSAPSRCGKRGQQGTRDSRLGATPRQTGRHRTAGSVSARVTALTVGSGQPSRRVTAADVAREPAGYWPRYSSSLTGPNHEVGPPSPPPRTVSCTTCSSGDAPCQCTRPAGREDRTPAGHPLDDLPVARLRPAPALLGSQDLPAGMAVPVRADPGLEAQPKRSHVGRVRPARLAADEVALGSRVRRWLAEREAHERARRHDGKQDAHTGLSLSLHVDSPSLAYPASGWAYPLTIPLRPGVVAPSAPAGAVAPSAPRESQVRTRRRLTESPVIGPRATLLPPESKGNGLRLAGEPSLG